MRKPFLTTFALAVAVLALLAVAPTAEACTQKCEFDLATFCSTCVETGEYTGATCQQSGSCGCFYTQNNCAAVQEDPEFLAEASLMTPATPPVEVAPRPEPVEVPAPAAD